MTEADTTTGPVLIVELHGGEKPTGGQCPDRRLGCLIVQRADEGPVQQVGTGGEVDGVPVW